MARILPLPPEAAAQIHSSRNITTLKDVVLALLENSLDAGSDRVELAVDFRRGDCTVEDNGHGITSENFREDGGLCKMYHSSKHVDASNVELHGTSGTYLASLSALCLLSISSCCGDSSRRAAMTVHRGRVVRRGLPVKSLEDVEDRILKGTTVAVRDLFGNMPVRVKHRALSASGSHDHDRELHGLKLGVVALLMAWPAPCSVKLRDTQVQSRVLNLSSAHPRVSYALTRKGLDQLAGRDIKFDLRDALPILTQASLAPIESRQHWIPVSALAKNVSVKGMICLNPAPTRQCQFISLGVHPCPHPDDIGMYEAVNSTFSASSFGGTNDDDDLDEQEKDRRKRDRRFSKDSFTRKQLHGRKGVDRWPMFVLQVRFTDKSKGPQVLGRLSEASLQDVIVLLKTTATQWLATNHFRPRKLRSSRDRGEPSTAHSASVPWSPEIDTPSAVRISSPSLATTSKKRKYVDIIGNTHMLERPQTASALGTTDPFSSWSKIKSGRSSFYAEALHGDKPATAPADLRGTVPQPGPPRPPTSLKLSVLEAGQLSATCLAQSVGDNSSARKTPRPFHETQPPLHEQLSSGDFGSFNDEDLLAIAGDLEGTDDAAQSMPRDTVPENHAVDDQIVAWTDPVTREVHQVSARTGMVIQSRPRTSKPGSNAHQAGDTWSSRQEDSVDRPITAAKLRMSLPQRPSSSRKPDRQWLPGFLQDWKNPVFTPQVEEPIAATSYELADAQADHSRCSHPPGAHHLANISNSVLQQLSKSALKRAAVIRQVDQKYILCSLRASPPNQAADTLILVDQHAASERVILERLLNELCAPVTQPKPRSRSRVNTMQLEKPLRFQISEMDASLLNKHKSHFETWGILYDEATSRAIMSASQVRHPKTESLIIVRSLPPGIAERCSLVPKLLIELLRAEVWRLAESGHKPILASEAECTHDVEEEHSWLKRLSSCPKGIIDMLNSRACRSAIMFNDELSVMQCEALMSDLSKCAFPFRCAHGRVSMVPLSVAGLVPQSPAIASDVEDGFVNAFRRWARLDRDDSNSTPMEP